METIEQIFAAFGALLIASGAITSLVLWLFKLFGEKWLSSKFAERLEAFKHEQQKEIEHLQFEINKLFDRTIKLHQREFDVLPKAWQLLAMSYHAVNGLTASVQSYPDISRMTPAQLDEFLSESPLENWRKDELKNATEQNRYYQDAIFWHRLEATHKQCRRSARFLLKNGIFIPPVLKEEFHKLEELAWAALAEHQMNKEHDLRPALRNSLEKFRTEGAPLIKQLEAEVQRRLWSSEKSD